MDYVIEHIGLPARDPAVLKDWYGRVLGAQVVFDNRQTPPTFLVEAPGGVLIEIYPGDTSVPATSNNRLCGWRHVALRVKSIDAAQAELATRGVTWNEPIKPAGGGGRVLFFADGEGNLLHLVERPAEWPHAGTLEAARV
jgi:glyoxylase I family protein